MSVLRFARQPLDNIPKLVDDLCYDTGKQNKITITNDKDRLSKEDIERMVRNAEQHKGEDDKQRERIGAKNSLESYCFNMKTTAEDEKLLKDKISESDKKTILDKCLSSLEGATGSIGDDCGWVPLDCPVFPFIGSDDRAFADSVRAVQGEECDLAKKIIT